MGCVCVWLFVDDAFPNDMSIGFLPFQSEEARVYARPSSIKRIETNQTTTQRSATPHQTRKKNAKWSKPAPLDEDDLPQIGSAV